MQTVSCTGPYIKSYKSQLDGDVIRANNVLQWLCYGENEWNFYFRLCKLCDDVIQRLLGEPIATFLTEELATLPGVVVAAYVFDPASQWLCVGIGVSLV